MGKHIHDEERVGYIVAGYEGNPERLVVDWDGDVYSTIEGGIKALEECRTAGYGYWNLYALTEVSERIEDPDAEVRP